MSTPAMPALCSLVQQRGAFISSKVAFEEDASSAKRGVGVRAVEHIKEGTVVISIPFGLCISVDSVTQLEPLKPLFDENPGLLDYPDEVLAVGLMFGRRADRLSNDDVAAAAEALLNAHVRTMPKAFNTSLYWSDDEMTMLRPSNAFHLTRLMKSQINNDWNSLHKPLALNYPEVLGHCTCELYQWALSVVYSRAVGITREGAYTRCIPPVLDMANHAPEAGSDAADTFRYDEPKDEVGLVCTSDRAIGDECYAVYGAYPNAKLAFSYGFVVLNNPHRAVDLWARVTPTSYEAATKQALLQASLSTRNQFYDFTGTIRPGFVHPALLATIRVIQICDEKEMASAANAFCGRMVSVRNELATYGSLRDLIVARMMVESAESDKLQLGQTLLSPDCDFSDRALMALIVRVDERELLHQVLPLVDAWRARLGAEGEAFVCPDCHNL